MDYRLIIDTADGLQRRVDGRMGKLGNVVPDAVQIGAHHRRSIVAVEHAVGIDHGYDFEFGELAQS